MPEVLFFRYSCGATPPPAAALPTGISEEVWRPHGVARAPGCGLSAVGQAVWPAFHALGVFRNRDHAILLLRRGSVCVHRTLILPPFFRFPFMAPNDLQCGDIWTHPCERGRGLARAGVCNAMHLASRPGRNLWYLTEAGNEPSQRLAVAAGFSLVGRGERSRRLGLRLLGQFLMTTPVESAR